MYNIIGNIGYITIKWHPIYQFSLWIEDKCLSEHSSLVSAIGEILESYSDAVDTVDYTDCDRGVEYVKSILEVRNWDVTIHEDIIEAVWVTPNGGEFYINLDIESPLSDLENQTSDFDVTEYVKEWLNSDACSLDVYDLTEDGEAIKKEFEAIYRLT